MHVVTYNVDFYLDVPRLFLIYNKNYLVQKFKFHKSVRYLEFTEFRDFPMEK